MATVRALKMHGGLPKTALAEENIPALEATSVKAYDTVAAAVLPSIESLVLLIAIGQ